MAKDLTAVLLPAGQMTEEAIRAIVAERDAPAFVRVAPLDSIGLIQVEIHEGAQGLPSEDPDLVAKLSKGGRATFVHVNHGASQAIVHGIRDGKPDEGFGGAPGDEFAAKLREALGRDLSIDQITAADDGSRIGIGIASARTVAYVGGGWLTIPPGTPTGANSFAFHDRGAGQDEDSSRMAPFAFDGKRLRALWSQPSGQIAATLRKAPPWQFGPLTPLAAEVADRLEKRGAQPPENDVRALELCALACAGAFAGGETVSYWDERVLPMLSLASDEPKIETADCEDLEDCDSLLHAMVEVLPFSAPPDGEGHLLAQLSDREIAPLAPWAKPGEEYAGAIFLADPTRLLPLVRSLDGRRLRALVEKLERTWYRAARPGQPEGDAFETFKKAWHEQGAQDEERCLRAWTELRIVFELANANALQPALLFYATK
jgi:hypothetical protein